MFVTSAMTAAQTLPAQARPAWRMLAPAAFAIAFATAGCASAPTNDPSDPFAPYNRGMDQINRDLDHAVLRPAARGYQKVVPDPLRMVISNVFANVSDVWSAANSALQLKLRNAGEDAARFAINTVLGFGGMFDIAERMNLERHREDFGLTLGHWGVPAGPYVVLPLFGPSSVRDALALPVDLLATPLRQVSPAADRTALAAGWAVDTRSKLLAVDPFVDNAPDPYLFLRDAYLQRREGQKGPRGDTAARREGDARAADANNATGAHDATDATDATGVAKEAEPTPAPPKPAG